MNFQNQVDYGQEFGFDVLSGVPEIAPLNRDTLKSHIMMRCGLLIPLYSEPETMQAAIAHWFNYMAYDISKMIELAQTEYLPLENYRRNENETIWRHIKDDDDTTITDTGTITDDLDGTTTNEVSAYNESTYSPERKQTVDQTNERTLDTERSDNRDYTRQHDERNSRTVYGNIGTMTTQDMFNQELDLLARFNPYDWIVDRMESELFLGIW